MFVRQSLKIFKRDVGRLARQRKSWIIVLGVLITPALYAWFNINAFWDPYENTQGVSVAVANLDSGAKSELTGDVNIGAQLTDELKANDQLGWQFMPEDDALEAVKRGDVYATIVIPEDFSENLFSLTTGDFTQPALKYYVNEKVSAIAPKITDVGASTLDSQITSAFKEQVAETATEALKDAGGSIEDNLIDARGNTLNAFDSAALELDAAGKDLVKMQDGVANSRTSLADARGTLGDVSKTLGHAQTAVNQAQGIITETQQQVNSFSAAATNAYLKAAGLIGDAAGNANAQAAELTQQLKQANKGLEKSIADLTKVVDANAAAISHLEDLLAAADPSAPETAALQSALDALKQQNTQHQAVLADLQAANGKVSGALDSLEQTNTALNQAVKGAQQAATDMNRAISQSMPAVNSAMTQLATSAGAFGSALGAQQAVVSEADKLLAGLDTQLASTGDAIKSFGSDVAGLKAGIETARADVLAIGSASEWGTLQTLTGLDPAHIANFVASPVTVEQHALFPVGSYGSAMAALFTNLSLWIGAFVLMVIFKIEVDTEWLEDTTVRQAYFGRFMLFAVLAALQALIVTIGNLVIGVQTVNAFSFVATGVFISFVYISIIYALSVAFGHVGRGLCVLLVIMQIPGASGMYPIELMPGFFKAIYPILPFSYGIDAMRETIGGFYGSHYWQYLGVLTIMMVLSFLLGTVLRKRLAPFNRLFNSQIESTNLMIGENVQIVDRGYRLADVMSAMRGTSEHGEEHERRSARFLERYPNLLRATVLTGLAGLAVIGVVAWILPGGKAPVLGIWVLWCLLLMGFIVVIEYIKQSYLDERGEGDGSPDSDPPADPPSDATDIFTGVFTDDTPTADLTAAVTTTNESIETEVRA